MIQRKPKQSTRYVQNLDVAVADLMVDNFNYQRELDQNWIKRHFDENDPHYEPFDPELLGTLEVASRENGELYVMDGQHRLGMCWEANVEHVNCNVHYGITQQDEAVFFSEFNKKRRAQSAYQDFRALLFGRDPQALEIDQVVRSHGYLVAPKGTPNQIAAVSALKRIHAKGGVSGLDLTLGLIEVWRGEHRSTDGELLRGVFEFIWKYGDKVKSYNEVTRKWNSVVPDRVLARAGARRLSAGGGVPSNVREVLADVYDANRKPENRLRPPAEDED